VLDREGRRYQMMVALPRDVHMLNEPVDPIFGDLRSGDDYNKARAILSCVLNGQKVYANRANAKNPILKGIDIDWIDTEIPEGADEAHGEIEEIRKAIAT